MDLSPQGRRWLASLPDDDPRFAELLAYLAAVRTRGRYSPAPRIIGEWALLGFLLQTGRIAGGAAPGAGDPAIAAVQAEVGAIARTAGRFDFE